MLQYCIELRVIASPLFSFALSAHSFSSFFLIFFLRCSYHVVIGTRCDREGKKKYFSHFFFFCYCWCRTTPLSLLCCGSLEGKKNKTKEEPKQLNDDDGSMTKHKLASSYPRVARVWHKLPTSAGVVFTQTALLVCSRRCCGVAYSPAFPHTPFAFDNDRR